MLNSAFCNPLKFHESTIREKSGFLKLTNWHPYLMCMLKNAFLILDPSVLEESIEAPASHTPIPER